MTSEWSDRLGEYSSDYAIGFADAGNFVHVELLDLGAREIRLFFDRVSRPRP